jgi:hypothetical protein
MYDTYEEMFYGVRRADSNAGNKRNADELEAS